MTDTLAPAIPHLSWSSISEYRDCPRRFYLRRIAKVPEERRSATLIFGGAVHRAIELIHAARLEGRRLPALKLLTKCFDSAWAAESKSGPEIAFPKEQTKESLRETAARMFAAYLGYIQSERGKVVAIEHEAVFRLLADAPPIKARLDLVAIEDSDLVVTDWKTASCRWSETKARESLPQLVLYAVAAAPMVRELGLKRIRPRFLVLTKSKEPAVQVLEQQASQDDVSRLKELVADTARGIQSGVFPRREGWQCKNCPFAVRCLGRTDRPNE